MKSLVYAPAARADFREIGRYIALDNPDRALSFVGELEAKAAQAVERPLSFLARDDRSRGLRAARHGKYLIFSRDLPGNVRVVRILHGARDLGRMFGGEGGSDF